MSPCECKVKKKRNKKQKQKLVKKLPSASRNFQPLPQYNIPPTINYNMPPQQPDNLLNFISSAMSIFDANRLPKREQKIFRNSDALPTKLYFDMATDTSDMPKREQKTFRNTVNGDALYFDMGTDTNDLLPQSFRDANVGEDVPIQSLVEQVQQPMWDNMSDISYLNDGGVSLQISEDTPSIPDVLPKPKLKRTQNNEDRIKEKMETDQMGMEDVNVLKGRSSPIIEEGEELITIIPKKRLSEKKKQKMERDQMKMEDINALIERPQQEDVIPNVTERRKRDKPRDKLIRDVESLLPDNVTRKQIISSYRREMNIKKSYQNFNIKELEDLLSYLTN